jgi:hypothetical protein
MLNSDRNFAASGMNSVQGMTYWDKEQEKVEGRRRTVGRRR